MQTYRDPFILFLRFYIVDLAFYHISCKVMTSKHLLGILRPLKLTTQHLIMVVEVSHKVRFLYCMMDVTQKDCNGIRKCGLLSPKCIISSAFVKKILNKMRIYICLEQSATDSFSPVHLCSLHDPYKKKHGVYIIRQISCCMKSTSCIPPNQNRRKKAFQWGATVPKRHKGICLDIKTLGAAAVSKLYCNNEQHFVFANWLCSCLLAQSHVCQAVAVCCNTVCAARSTPGFPESLELTFSAGRSLRQMGPLDRLFLWAPHVVCSSRKHRASDKSHFCMM